MPEGEMELGHVVDIDDTLQLLFDYEAPLQSRSKHHAGSMYMVPSVCRDLSPRSYTPRVVSIGPLHHEDEHLKGFEVEKAAYMQNLLHNILSPLDSTPEEILKSCGTKISGSVDQIKACYVGMKIYTDAELVKMMVMDACFIMAFIYSMGESDYSNGQSSLLYTQILVDMVLIENQIPFFVLQDIFDCTFLKHFPESSTLSELIFGFVEIFHIFEGDLVMDDSNISSTHDHIVGFIHKYYQNPDHDDSPRPSKTVKKHSAVELDRSGVRFSNKLDAKWRMAMELKYSRFLCFPLSLSKPTLNMPVLRINDYSELLIRNLIIYEHSSQVQACFTSYMYAMDHLIDTPEDVAKLVRSQVLVNDIGSNEEAADIINSICKEVPIREFCYLDEWKKMDEYYNAYWPNHIAELRRNYFSNPWSIIALVAGIVLFVLTAVQTICSVKVV